jgi:hypothetical protein
LLSVDNEAKVVSGGISYNDLKEEESMKKFVVLFSVFMLIVAGSLGVSTNAKALSVLDPGVSPIGCCSNIEWSDSLGAWMMAVPCVALAGEYYTLTLIYNPSTGGFDIWTVGYDGDGSCANGSSTVCSDCSCPAYASAHPGECGATGALNFRITWNDQNDVDIHVTYNDSEHIYYGNKSGSTTGGTLDVEWNGAGEVLLGGPAEIVFSGEWPDTSLEP